MTGRGEVGYKPARGPIRTDSITYRAVKIAADSQAFPTTLRAVVREAVRSRFPEEFEAARRMEATAEAAEAAAAAEAGAALAEKIGGPGGSSGPRL